MSGLSDYACDGEIVIGSVNMNCGAWALAGDEDGEGSLFDLMTLVDQRGEDRVVGYAAGVIAYPRRITATEQQLRLVVAGDENHLGVPFADHTIGLETNLRYLMANVVSPVASASGTRTMTYTTPGGTELTGDVHVTGIKRKTLALGQNALWIGTMTISIPGGQLT